MCHFSLSSEEFQQLFDYGVPRSDKDFEYTWENFQDVSVFWHKPAADRGYVLFTGDQ